MLALAWLILFLGVAAIALGITPALPRQSVLLHYLAAVLGGVVLIFALIRLVD